MSWSARAAIGVIRAYQLAISPFSGGACRFVPSCSAYAVEAVMEHGAWRGFWLAAKRVARCHPFSRYGFDPVPRRQGSD
jgi:putative membrane protein insertion efficiency factor